MVSAGVPWTDRLRTRAPGVHRFLTRGDRPYPLVREVLGFTLVLLLGALLLWGGTGQPFPSRPIVVVESASMMHCVGAPHSGNDDADGHACKAVRYGRFGTIDPGDLIFVRDIDGQDDVVTCLSGGEVLDGGRRATCGSGSDHYGHNGDVLIYRPNGDAARTPVIHRALFWLQLNADGTFTIPELGPAGSRLQTLDDLPALDQGDGLLIPNLGIAPTYGAWLDSRLRHMGVERTSASGFVMLGDNNPRADQQPEFGGIADLPAKPEWVLGKARGEVPWIGLVNLGFQELRGGGSGWYSRSPSDIKTMFWLSAAVLVALPWVVGALQRRRHRRRAADAGPRDAP